MKMHDHLSLHRVHPYLRTIFTFKNPSAESLDGSSNVSVHSLNSPHSAFRTNFIASSLSSLEYILYVRFCPIMTH